MDFKEMDSFAEVLKSNKELNRLYLQCLVVVDIDECDTGLHDCHMNATCNNTSGSYTCTCNNQLFGNGTHCNSMNIIPFNCNNNIVISESLSRSWPRNFYHSFEHSDHSLILQR